MGRVGWLADVLRTAGVVVVEEPGWAQRGAPTLQRPEVIVCHHTATPARAKGDLPSLRLLVEGRADLAGPLCQLALSRSGIWHTIASGKANHAGTGAWRGTASSLRTIGIEAEHPGDGTPWPDAQVDSYLRGCAALVRHLRLSADAVCGHREWALPAGRKVDPRGIDMDAFRAAAAQVLADLPRRRQSAPAADVAVPGLPRLEVGASGTHVRLLQGLLVARGKLHEADIDGVFGPVTGAAVVAAVGRDVVDGRGWAALLAVEA